MVYKLANLFASFKEERLARVEFKFFIRKKRGFTLVEIMVTVAIIGLLLTLAIPNFINARNRTNAMRILADFKAIERAFRFMGEDQGRTTWWLEWDFGCATDIPTLFQNTKLGSYLMVAPSPPVAGANYLYDNDGDTFVHGAVWCGVNLCLLWVDEEYCNLLDELVDGGDGGLDGKITFYSGGGSHSQVNYRMADSSANF